MNLDRLISCLKAYGCDVTPPDAVGSSSVPSFLGVRAGQSLNHLTVYARHYSDAALPDQAIERSLGSIGSALASDASLYRTRAGWLCANPAVIWVTEPNQDMLSGFAAISFAREGLLNQKTAVGAVRRFENALKNQGGHFSAKTVIPLTRMANADSHVQQP